MKILFVRSNKDSFGFKPIGLSLLSGIARSLGWESRLFDTTQIDFGFVDNTQAGQEAKIFRPVDLSEYGMQKKKLNPVSEFQRVLEEFNPDCLAFSVLSDEAAIASRLTEAAKDIKPETPVIWGGKYPTLNPEMTLKELCVDFVCVGEGLDAFADFLNALSNSRDLLSIQNIWARSGKGIIKNSVRPLRSNLDDLPFVDWEIFDRRQFYKPFDGKVYVGGDHMLNWGCPYHCTYCVNDFYHRMYDGRYVMRRYGVTRIVGELKHLKDKYKLEFFKFHDEDFLMRPFDNLRQLSQVYKQEVNIPFVIETNPKSVTAEKVRCLKDMNCVSVSIAIETGDPYLRKKLLKRVDSEEDVVRAFSLLKDVGIRTVSFNMFGIPFESRQTYRATVELNRKADVQYPASGFFYPFEGTELREVSIREGLFDPQDEAKSVYRRDRPALHFDHLSEEELIQMRNVFVLYVKLPRVYEPFIRRSEIKDELGLELRNKLLEIYDKTVWHNDGWYIDDGLRDKYISELNACIERHKEVYADKPNL